MSNVSPLFFFLPLVFLAPNSCRFSLSLSLSGVGSHRIRVAFWLFLLPSPRALLFFLSLFFLLCKIWLNVCNRTNAHGLTARSSALRCVSMESARDTSLALSPSARALAQNKKGAKCRSASTSLPALRWVRALLSTESPRDAERTCERATKNKAVTTLTTNRSCSFIGVQ